MAKIRNENGQKGTAENGKAIFITLHWIYTIIPTHTGAMGVFQHSLIHRTHTNSPIRLLYQQKKNYTVTKEILPVGQIIHIPLLGDFPGNFPMISTLENSPKRLKT